MNIKRIQGAIESSQFFRKVAMESLDLEGESLTLSEIIRTEKNVHRLGTGIVRDWLQGLPTNCTVPFANYDIIQLGCESGLLSENASDDDCITFTEAYWQAMGYHVLQLTK